MAESDDAPGDIRQSCSVCANPNRLGSKFCRHCGADIAAARPATEMVPSVEVFVEESKSGEGREESAPPDVAFRATTEAVDAAPISVEASRGVGGLGAQCRHCATANRVGAKFCSLCGKTLEGTDDEEWPSVAAPDLTQRAEKTGTIVEGGSTSVPARKLLIGAGGALAISVVSFAAWYGMRKPEPNASIEAAVASQPGELSPRPAVPPAVKASASGLQGVYSAHLADQDISLAVTGGTPKPLEQIAAVITYKNVVNSIACVASLKLNGRTRGSTDTRDVAGFAQTTVAGAPACPQPIPLKLDVTGQPRNAGGVVQAVQATWLSPADGEVLMTGRLVRDAGR